MKKKLSSAVLLLRQKRDVVEASLFCGLSIAAALLAFFLVCLIGRIAGFGAI
jgi:hypothetical protein